MGSNAQALGALLGNLLKFGGKGYMQGSQVQQYANAVNSGLPQGYQIPTPDSQFFFGDPRTYAATMKAGADMQWKRFQNDTQVGDYNTHMGTSFKSPQVASTIYSGEYAPVNKERGLYQVDLDKGHDELVSSILMDLLPNGGSPSWQTQAYQASPPDYKTSLPDYKTSLPPLALDGSTPQQQPQALQASAQQVSLPELPANLKITPEGLRSYRTNKVAQQNANTTAQRLAFDKETMGPQRMAQTQRIQKQIEKIAMEMKYYPQMAKARIEALNRSGRGSGRAITEIEMLMQAGYNPKEIGKMILDKWQRGGMGGGFPAFLNIQPPASTGPRERDYGGNRVTF